ncbi:hypothetical protein GGS23DRAFT_585353 [Durotheca rogersii]|uniref:uncharacterized protein n=1 Tax=Durotheca rogersii TaxID=419775 RepID=UPI00221F16D7|nr:uncharacterized protein GGS23DRAFT_585353 [Durotheca rogersii]KAI5859418.1 hypothetical protein GGS23DRAFT_585353 [Durotheca rogersii]
MRYQAATGAAVLAGFTMLQSCPAPVWQLVPAIAGIVAGALEITVSEIGKRDVDGEEFNVETVVATDIKPDTLNARAKYCMPVPKGVPENVISNCCNSLRNAHIKITGKNPKSGIKITGIPYPCISAAPWFDGVGAVPFACGSDCLQYADLTNAEYNQVRKAFLDKAKK